MDTGEEVEGGTEEEDTAVDMEEGHTTVGAEEVAAVVVVGEGEGEEATTPLPPAETTSPTSASNA